MKRMVSAVVSVGLLAVALVPSGSVGAAGAAAGPGPVGYAYATEWIYSTDASETVEAVATDAAGRVYLGGPAAGGPGTSAKVVHVYDADGAPRATWEMPFTAASTVGGMAVDPAGNVYVSDYIGASIDVYSKTGQFLRSYRMNDDGDHTTSLAGIGIGPNGWIYAASPTADQVVVFDVANNRQGTFGGSGSAPGKLNAPWGLGIAPDGSVVVADRRNHRIEVFTADGDYVTSWGGLNGGPEAFVGEPQEVEVRDDGVVLVVDLSDQVKAFTLAGVYLGSVTATTKSAGTMSEKTGLAFGPGRELYLSGSPAPFQNGVVKYVLAGAGAGIAKVKAPKKGVRVAKKKLKITVKCISATPCSGTVTVRTKKGKPLAKPKAYAIPAGAKKKVKVKLTKKGLKTVRKKRVTKAVVTVTGSSKKIKVRR
ncbi:hypothetical protein [Nocardioides humi]|uniref:NHL repeat-containing protein n=1 Tax=Nocardioides humi TaxID=449461 RepID=A0ABN1ZS60_9ACTN|nr:hypothetical protein [Nocardioides humi]